MNDKITTVIVDDDPRLLKAYDTKFTNEGIEAHVVGNAEQAIETIRNIQPNVVVLDVLMPGKSGWDILREMQADSEMQEIPVLMVSNIGSDDKEAEAISAGAAAYLVKSDTPLTDLVERIQGLAGSPTTTE